MLGEKAWKLFTENVLQNVLSVSAITWAQSNTFLQVVVSCMPDCRSLGGHLRWCKLDVIAWCHKMMSLMMSHAFITRNNFEIILWWFCLPRMFSRTFSLYNQTWCHTMMSLKWCHIINSQGTLCDQFFEVLFHLILYWVKICIRLLLILFHKKF